MSERGFFYQIDIMLPFVTQTSKWTWIRLLFYIYDKVIGYIHRYLQGANMLPDDQSASTLGSKELQTTNSKTRTWTGRLDQRDVVDRVVGRTICALTVQGENQIIVKTACSTILEWELGILVLQW